MNIETYRLGHSTPIWPAMSGAKGVLATEAESNGGQGGIRTPVAVRHLVYSQAHLTALIPTHVDDLAFRISDFGIDSNIYEFVN